MIKLYDKFYYDIIYFSLHIESVKTRKNSRIYFNSPTQSQTRLKRHHFPEQATIKSAEKIFLYLF